MEMDQKTKIMLAWELHEQDISNSQIAKRLEVNRETVNRWISAIRGQDQGLLGYLERFRATQKQPRPSRQIPLSTNFNKAVGLAPSGTKGKQLNSSTVELLRSERLRQSRVCNRLFSGERTQDYSFDADHLCDSESEVRSPAKGRKKTARGPIPEAVAPREVVLFTPA